MTIKNLYKYEESDGSVTVTPIQRQENDPVDSYRLIADEGKVLSKDDELYSCIDTHEIEGWNEIDAPEEVRESEEIEEQQ